MRAHFSLFTTKKPVQDTPAPQPTHAGPPSLRLLANRYEVRGKPLATSKRAHVEFATDRDDGESVVVKFSNDHDAFVHEREFLSEHEEEGICHLKDSFNIEDHGKTLHCLVLEAGDEDLSMYWERKKRNLGPAEASWTACSLAVAVKCLHDQGFVHCDIKPQNFIRFFDGGWKLIDFEMAVKEGEGTRGHTIGYMSPENARVYPSGIVAEKPQDIWSLGAVMYELMTGRNFLDYLHSSEAVLSWLRGTEEMPLPSSLPEAQQDLLTLMLRKDPGLRPTIDAVLLHPALQAQRCSSRRPSIADLTAKARDALSLSLVTSSTQVGSSLPEKEPWERERANLQERINALAKDKARLIEERSKLEQRLEWSQSQTASAKEDLKRLGESVGRLQKMKEEVEKEKMSLRKENGQLRILKDRLGRLEGEHARSLREMDELRAALALASSRDRDVVTTGGGAGASSRDSGVVTGGAGASSRDSGVVTGGAGASSRDCVVVMAGRGASSRDSGVVTAGAGASSRDSGVVTAGAGASSRDCGVVVAGAGTSSRDCGVVVAGAGTSSRDCGVVVAGAGTSSRDCGVVVAGAGTSSRDCGVVTAGRGASSRDSGVVTAAAGASSRESGVVTAGTGGGLDVAISPVNRRAGDLAGDNGAACIAFDRTEAFQEAHWDVPGGIPAWRDVTPAVAAPVTSRQPGLRLRSFSSDDFLSEAWRARGVSSPSPSGHVAGPKRPSRTSVLQTVVWAIIRDVAAIRDPP